MKNPIDELAYASGARTARHTTTLPWRQLGAARWELQSIWSNGKRVDNLHGPMKPSVMSGASTRPASACGDGANGGELSAHAVHLLAQSTQQTPGKQTPPSLEAPPSLETPPSQEAPPSQEDFMDKCRKVHSYLTSARTLSQELHSLKITQQTQRAALKQRIDECYQEAYNLSELTC